jgi:hypothetical protein
MLAEAPAFVGHVSLRLKSGNSSAREKAASWGSRSRVCTSRVCWKASATQVATASYTFPDHRHRSWRDTDGFRILRTGAEEWLAEERPVYALIREWCGEGAAEEFDQVLPLRGEVDRLRTVLEDTLRWLRLSGHPVKAALLDRELNKTSEPEQKR